MLKCIVEYSCMGLCAAKMPKKAAYSNMLMHFFIAIVLSLVDNTIVA